MAERAGAQTGRVRIPVDETRAGGGQGVDVGRLQVRGAEAAEVVAAQIVGHDDDEIRTARRGGGQKRRARRPRR